MHGVPDDSVPCRNSIYEYLYTLKRRRGMDCGSDMPRENHEAAFIGKQQKDTYFAIFA